MSGYVVYVGHEGSNKPPMRYQMDSDDWRAAVESVLKVASPETSVERLAVASVEGTSMLLRGRGTGVLVHVEGLTPHDKPSEAAAPDPVDHAARTATWQGLGEARVKGPDTAWRLEATQVMQADAELQELIGGDTAEVELPAFLRSEQGDPASGPESDYEEWSSAEATQAMPVVDVEGKAAKRQKAEPTQPKGPQPKRIEPPPSPETTLGAPTEDWMQVLLVKAMKAAHQLVPATRSMLLLPDRGRLKVQVAWGEEASLMAGARLDVDAAPGLSFFLQPSTLTYHGAGGTLRYKKGWFGKHEASVHSLLAVPVLGKRREVLAVMLMVDRPGDEGFGSSDVEALVYLAGLVQNRIQERVAQLAAARSGARGGFWSRRRRPAPVPA